MIAATNISIGARQSMLISETIKSKHLFGSPPTGFRLVGAPGSGLMFRECRCMPPNLEGTVENESGFGVSPIAQPASNIEMQLLSNNLVRNTGWRSRWRGPTR